MTITLTPEQEKFIAEAVASGLYATPDDVVGASLARLEEQQSWKAATKAAIQTALEDQAADRFVSSEDFLAEIKQRRRKTA